MFAARFNGESINTIATIHRNMNVTCDCSLGDYFEACFHLIRGIHEESAQRFMVAVYYRAITWIRFHRVVDGNFTLQLIGYGFRRVLSIRWKIPNDLINCSVVNRIQRRRMPVHHRSRWYFFEKWTESIDVWKIHVRIVSQMAKKTVNDVCS